MPDLGPNCCIGYQQMTKVATNNERVKRQESVQYHYFKIVTLNLFRDWRPVNYATTHAIVPPGSCKLVERKEKKPSWALVILMPGFTLYE